jgi:hypothetical protein
MTKENALLSSLFVNLKGSKKKKEDWISIAKRCEEIARKTNSHKAVAEKLGVSPELVRAILSLLELPLEVQRLIKEGKILFDAAQRINTIKDKKKQVEVAKTIAGLTSHEQREIIQYAKKYPNSTLSNFKKRVTSTLTTEKMHVAIIPLSEESFRILQNESIRKKLTLEKIILGIINDWRKKKGKSN